MSPINVTVDFSQFHQMFSTYRCRTAFVKSLFRYVVVAAITFDFNSGHRRSIISSWIFTVSKHDVHLALLPDFGLQLLTPCQLNEPHVRNHTRAPFIRGLTSLST